MSRKTVRITLDNMDTVPEPCRSCLFWQLDPVRRSRLDAAESAAEKRAWISRVLREWGSCGQILLQDDEPRGFAIYAPWSFTDGAASLPTAPVSSDALLLTTVYVDPAARGGGLGRMLVQGMARDLVKADRARAVEAFGARNDWSRGDWSRGCVVPAGFLSAVGFKTQRAHPTNPRMRMELGSALPWKDEVEQAVERLLGAVRPVRPAPKTVRPDAGRLVSGRLSSGRLVSGRTVPDRVSR